MVRFLLAATIMSSNCIAESEVSLSEATWKYRIVIGATSSPSVGRHLQQQLSAYPELRQERKLIGIVQTNDDITQVGNPSLVPERSAKDISTEPETVVLIGLDGTVKRRYAASTFDIERMLSHIDAMPMRRRELKYQ